MRFMGGVFSDSDNQIVRDVIKKMQEGYDFEKNINDLSTQEKYTYIGICTGINTVITMAENNLNEKSAFILNKIFGENIFVWDDATDDSQFLQDLENGEIDKEDLENIMSESVINNIINNNEETKE